MRNIFDQYEQPENKLTHALISTLSNDRRLIRPFLKRLKIGSIPPVQGLRLVEQQIPGVNVPGEETEAKGLPDACIFDDKGWALLLESKVQASVSRGQLERHLKSAARNGYENVHVVAIAVNAASDGLPERAKTVEWRELYKWFRKLATVSTWAGIFVEYMQVFESRMIAKEYLRQGMLTMFDGLRFDENNPYTHREAKRLIRLLRDELQRRKDLQELGVDPTGEGRSALTGRGSDAVWDFLPLKQARGAVQFTAFPHLTLKLSAETAVAAVTVPNGVKGGFRTKLKEGGVEGFRSLVEGLERSLRHAKRVQKSKGVKPFLYVHQRHFLSQKSGGITDGRLEVDLRTLTGCSKAGVYRQPEWIDAIYNLLTHKHSNIQFGVEVRFKYDCPIVGSREVVDLFADTWSALKPLLDFIL
jgi:hypothetical protein